MRPDPPSRRYGVAGRAGRLQLAAAQQLDQDHDHDHEHEHEQVRLSGVSPKYLIVGAIVPRKRGRNEKRRL